MKNNRFFNPSPLYKEFMLLDVIEKYDSITQRDMSSFINGSISMVNEYLTRYEAENYIKRHYQTKKNVKYVITELGIERKKLLNLWFLSDSHRIYLSAKENILNFLGNHTLENSSLYLYGAGEMAEILLDVIENTPSKKVHVLGLIDDDPNKLKNKFRKYDVYLLNDALKTEYDYIFVSSYNYHETIVENLITHKVSSDKILRFFS